MAFLCPPFTLHKRPQFESKSVGPCGDVLARCGHWVVLPVGVVRPGGQEGPDAVRGDTGEGATGEGSAAGLGWMRIRAETE